MSSPTLDLGVIGNGSFGALVDKQARVVWSCLPAFDGDPAFCALLSPRDHDGGDFSIELEDFADSEQHYLANTAILRTVLRDAHGGAVEVIDFAPRWRNNGRCPATRASACWRVRWPTGARASRKAPGAATTCAGCCPISPCA